MDPTTVRAAVRRFPLLGEARPACLPLPDRVTEIAQIAEAAAGQGGEGMHEAAHALNKAALLASDCGLAEYARQLCWAHIDVYRAAGSRLTARQARYLLEPVHNLARLDLRVEAGQRALRLLEAMHRAVTDNTDLVVDGKTLPLANPTGTHQERYQLREWVWRQYLADGIRALTHADCWDDAVTHAAAHQGIGRHLMNGRQAAIIAHCLNGQTPAARTLLAETTLTQPWEHQVAACLAVLCATADTAGLATAAMIDHFQAQEPTRRHIVYRTRLGLTAVTLATETLPDSAAPMLTQVAADAIECGDGYAAQDVQNHPSPDIAVSDQQRVALAALVRRCGLRSGTLPDPLLASVVASVESARETLAASMRSSMAAG